MVKKYERLSVYRNKIEPLSGAKEHPITRVVESTYQGKPMIETFGVGIYDGVERGTGRFTLRKTGEWVLVGWPHTGIRVILSITDESE